MIKSWLPLPSTHTLEWDRVQGSVECSGVEWRAGLYQTQKTVRLRTVFISFHKVFDINFMECASDCFGYPSSYYHHYYYYFIIIIVMTTTLPIIYRVNAVTPPDREKNRKREYNERDPRENGNRSREIQVEQHLHHKSFLKGQTRN